MSSEIVKLAPVEQAGAIEVRQQVNQIQYLMREVLKDGEHFGVVPGTKGKPTLYQSGAEKIAYMFHFVPTYDVERSDLGGGHREYSVTCTLTSRESGQVMGGGMGSCSTMESKYRYRNQWANGQKRRVENPDIADCWNTVLKMAKKRAFVDAVKSTTAASDIFTQDIEDMPGYMAQHQQQPPVVAQAAVSDVPQPQRTARLDTLRALMSDAKALGVCVQDKADPSRGLMGWVRATYGCEPDELSDAQIAECEEHVRAVIDGERELARQAETAAALEPEYEYGLADHDIDF